MISIDNAGRGLILIASFLGSYRQLVICGEYRCWLDIWVFERGYLYGVAPETITLVVYIFAIPYTYHGTC